MLTKLGNDNLDIGSCISNITDWPIEGRCLGWASYYRLSILCYMSRYPSYLGVASAYVLDM